MNTLAERFWDEWQHGEPDVRKLIADNPVSPDELLYILRIEQCQRWQRGKGLPAERYLDWFPTLAEAERAVELVYSEFLAREAAGLKPVLDEFLRRFPALADRLRQQIELHLALDSAEITRNGSPSTFATTIFSPPPAGPLSPLDVPGYTMGKLLGRGGMGAVYEAIQLRARRTVALKMIIERTGEWDERERFRIEAEAAARLQHPNIVQLFEVGEHQGRPFFSMELVAGGSLAARLLSGPLESVKAAKLVRDLALAMQHAHDQGVVHRDLKPGNVLLTADGTPKVADFGLARRLDSASFQTHTGSVLGTPSYMAPEQAEGKKEVGPAADIYSLGAILYECLTGRPPFKGPTAIDTLFQVVANDAVPPRRLQSSVPVDLEAVCLKCLEKNPRSRYPSARALADDLDRILDHKPTVARPATLLGQVLRWLGRRPAVAAMLFATGAVALAAFLTVMHFWVDAIVQKNRAREAETKARKRADAEAKARRDTEVERGKAREEQKKAENATREIARQLERNRDLTFTAQCWRAEQKLMLDPLAARKLLDSPTHCPPELRDFSWGLLRHQTQLHRTTRIIEPKERTVLMIASNDGTCYALQDEKGNVRLYKAQEGELLLHLPPARARVTAIAVAPLGRRLAVGDRSGLVRLVDLPPGKPVGKVRHLTWTFADRKPREVLALEFSSDGKQLAVAGGQLSPTPGKTRDMHRYLRGTVWLWDTEKDTGKPLFEWKEKDRFHPTPQLSGVKCVALSSDRKWLAAGASQDSFVRLYDVTTGECLHQFQQGRGRHTAVTFSPDRTRLAIGTNANLIQLYDLTTFKRAGKLAGHQGAIRHLRFSQNSRSLISSANDNTVRLWDVSPPRIRTILRPQATEVVGIAHEKFFRLLIATPQEIQGWTMREPEGTPLMEAPRTEGLFSLAYNPNNKILAAGEDNGSVHLYLRAFNKRKILGGHKSRVTALQWDAAGKRLFSASLNGTVRLWRPNGKKRFVHQYDVGNKIVAMALLPDEKTLVTATRDADGGKVQYWDVESRKATHTFQGHKGGTTTLIVDASRKQLLTAGADPRIAFRDLKTGKEQAGLSLKGDLGAVAVSRTGEVALILDGWVHRRDGNPGHAPRLLEEQEVNALSLALTPDGKTLAVGCIDNRVRLYHVVSGHLRAELSGNARDHRARVPLRRPGAGGRERQRARGQVDQGR